MGKTARILVLAAVLLALVLVAVALAVSLPRQAGIPAGAQSALDAYLSYRAFNRTEMLVVTQVREAAYPGRFDQGMSDVSLGDSVYYRTTISYTLGSVAGQMPLPYPPAQVWCAAVTRRSDDTSAGQKGVVFLALHQDIYNADWVAHEASDDVFSERSLAVAEEIGCRLKP